VTKPFNPKESYLAIKSHEGMIAFTGFLIRLEENGPGKEGILKISSYHKAYGGGYLTLTFIVDTGNNAAVKEQLDFWFDRLQEGSLKDYVGSGLEQVNKISIDTLGHIGNWYIEEINLHFRSLKGQEKSLVEQYLIPGLENILACTFYPVEWWPMDQAKKDESVGLEFPASLTPDFLKGLFGRWFKSG
jgi:hypothetical protein